MEEIKFNKSLFDDISTTIYNVLNKYKEKEEKEEKEDDKNKQQDNCDGIILSNKLTCSKLLEQDDLKEDDVFFVNEPSCKEIFNYDNPEIYFQQLNNGSFYYPPKPHYKHLSLVLMSWASNNKFPIQFQPLYGLNEVVKSEQEKDNISIFKKDTETGIADTSVQVVEDKGIVEIDVQKIELLHFETINETVVQYINNKWKIGNGTDGELQQQGNFKFIYQFFKGLTNRNLLTMFSIRKTKLSLDNVLLPGPIELIKSSNLLHSPPPASSKLTVSSRALSKHGIRSKDSFWGSDKGPEAVKNKRSEGVLIKILREPAWINIHLLPHDIQILEIRNKDGYGLRWSADGSFFRGYLEPQMENGHEIGWRH